MRWALSTHYFATLIWVEVWGLLPALPALGANTARAGVFFSSPVYACGTEGRNPIFFPLGPVHGAVVLPKIAANPENTPPEGG